MYKRIIALFLCFLIACSGTQTPLPNPPSVYNGDVANITLVDQDAYNITLPPVEDVAVNLQVVDGGGPNGERIAPLRVTQPAPFNGVLFNGPAIARINVEFRGQAAQCRIDRQADLDRIAAMARRDIGFLNSSLVSQRDVYQVMLRSRDQEINRLFTYIQNNNQPRINFWPYIGIGLGGLVLGAGIATGIYFSVR